MAGIERFEDIKAWQKGRQLCKLVYAATKVAPFNRDYALCNQMRRAAISVVSNIAEGFESQNDRTFVKYLYMARASSGEVRAQAYIALDQEYISNETFQKIRSLADETSRLIASFIRYLERSFYP
jgi:four helix bundle protein